MRHLSHDDIVDAAEGSISRATHLAACEDCRARVHELRAIIGMTRESEIPEPSPLFWHHFSDRVRDAVAAEPQPSRRPFFGLAWAAGGAAVAIILIGFVVTMRTGQPAPSGIAATAGRVLDSKTGPTDKTTQAEAAVAPSDSISDDATWVLMGEFASQIDWEDASEAGLMTSPGSADRAMDELSTEEQRAVVELLEQEIQKSKSL